MDDVAPEQLEQVDSAKSKKKLHLLGTEMAFPAVFGFVP